MDTDKQRHSNKKAKSKVTSKRLPRDLERTDIEDISEVEESQ